jgi:hypothetical protein
VSSAAQRFILLASVALGIGAISFVAFGWWSGGGSGSAGAAAATLGAPGTPSVSVTASVASVSWSAASAPGAGAVDYHIERRETSDSVWRDVCGTTASIRITALDCSDVPGDGTFVWRVTAFFHSWTATSGESNSVTIDSKPPTGEVTAPASGANVAGTLTVTSDSADGATGTGVASVQFQTSPAGADSWTDLGAADTTSPYSASWNTTTFSDGLYDLRVITTDNAGLTFTSPTVTSVVVDNVAPTVSLALANAPTGAYLSAGKVYFRSNAAGSFGFVATVVDALSGPASVTFPALSAAGWTTHNAETDTTPAGGPYASSTFAWASGASAPAAYTVSAADGSGNTATSSITFTIDSTAPTGAVTAPVAAANVRGSVAVTSNSADAGSGVASAQFQASPAGAGTWSNVGALDTASPYTTAWDTTTSTDGLYDLRVITADNVGNMFTSATIANVRVDNTPPSGSVTAPAASAAIKGTFTLTSNSADTGSGVANALFQRSPAGTNTWTNVAAADTTSPYTASWVTTGVSDGLYDLQVITTDKSGNALTSALTTNVRVDNAAPTGAVTAPVASANVRGSVAVTSNSADAGSGVASARFQSSPHNAATWTNVAAVDTTSPYSVTWDTTTSTDGLYDLRVITTDNAGTTFTSATIANVRIDNTAPTGAITAPAASATIRGTFTLTSNSADGGSGVASALFQRSIAGANTWTNVAAADTVSPYTASWVTTGVSDGLYDLQVITTDKSGNAFTSALITNVRVDNTAPAVSVVVANGAPSAFQSGTRIYFKSNVAGSFGLVATVTDTGSGAASATFPLLATVGWIHAVETVSTPAGGPYASTSFVWASGASTPGTYTVTMVDAAGNTATSAFTFTADVTAPTGSLTAPVAAANLRGSAAVTSNSADASSGVGSAQFQISPAGAGTWSNLGAADAITPFATTWDTTASSDAIFDLRVITTDNVGNTFTSATIANVRVDNTAPTGSITAPAANAFVNGASVAVSANSADAGSGVSSAQFQTSPHGAGTWSNLGAADATSPYGVTWNSTTYADGQYDLRVITTDRSGNTFTSAAVMAEVQNAAPTATAVQLLDGGGTAGTAEQGDRIVVTFSETLRVSTLCSIWSGDFSDQTLAALSDVTVTLADGVVASDTVTLTSASCAFHFGSINLGSTGYATGGNVTFSGSTTADRSTIAWSATTRTLTITLGHGAGLGSVGTVASSAATYTPDAAIKSGFGTTITGTFNTGILTLF